ncbi:MAG: dicarboxylate/amino acid:cation symporter [Clostridium sp.]|uniref:dicarboxylate/amino acid:cation symporter n=1 Tax=Clostridium sp. TaxID=1506 RepID=UPI003D6D88B5
MKLFKMNLTKKIFVALILGIIYGIVSNILLPKGFNLGVNKWILSPVGSIFFNLIKMVVVPLVFFSLICGSASIGDTKKLGRVSGKIIAFYMVTTSFAVVFGLFFANLLKPGVGVVIPSNATVQTTKPPFIMDIFVNMVPSNPFDALVKGDMLQIIVFAIFLGVTISIIGEPVKPLLNICNQLNDVFLKIIGTVMKLAPYGVFALIAKVISLQGLDILVSLVKLIGVVYFALIIHCLVTYFGSLKLIGHLSPIKFFKKFWPVMMFGFSTSSSSATIPVNLEACENKLGVKSSIASFTIPLGATINMDGTAIMQGVGAVFIAQVYGIELSLSSQILIILSATLASIGTAGVPGAGTIMLSMVVTQVGLPIEGIALILAVDRILDMGRTMLNITGDAIGTCLVAASEKELDVDIFNSDDSDVTVKP